MMDNDTSTFIYATEPRIIVDLLEKQQHNISVRVKQRDADQSMSQEPVISTTILFKLNGQDSLERVE